MLTRRRFLIGAGLIALAGDVPLRRLLMAGGGSGGYPHTGGTVTEQGAWVRESGNPIVTPTLSWEHNGIQEPSVIYDGVGDWKMLARAAWTTTAAIEYFT